MQLECGCHYYSSAQQDTRLRKIYPRGLLLQIRECSNILIKFKYVIIFSAFKQNCSVIFRMTLLVVVMSDWFAAQTCMADTRLCCESRCSAVIPSCTVGTFWAALQTLLVTEGAQWTTHSSDTAHLTVTARWADVACGAVCRGGVVGTTCTVMSRRALCHRFRITWI